MPTTESSSAHWALPTTNNVMDIPFYISMPAADYPDFLATDGESRFEITTEALEEENLPVEDIDKMHFVTEELLAKILDADTAHAIIYGTLTLEDPGYDEIFANSPEDAARLAAILNNINHDEIEDSLAIYDLTDIYNDARDRGDAIITVWG
ncbi:hypothetical protein CGLAU_01810 [Corynebacterium glaucum]|uniref:DUF1877 domain-containing protein n=2 Tax=Corynebacterium glaucum TaxID=187491 RepID=A0A1Q2HU32_9CORY|nr:hypothetical protein CGLAU_01810 [Corynebacterium glaucum]WJZ06879.1 hypothetical protein CGLAUT_01865 [Corynebacterium glaucum]